MTRRRTALCSRRDRDFCRERAWPKSSPSAAACISARFNAIAAVSDSPACAAPPSKDAGQASGLAPNGLHEAAIPSVPGLANSPSPPIGRRVSSHREWVKPPARSRSPAALQDWTPSPSAASAAAPCSTKRACRTASSNVSASCTGVDSPRSQHGTCQGVGLQVRPPSGRYPRGRGWKGYSTAPINQLLPYMDRIPKIERGWKGYSTKSSWTHATGTWRRVSGMGHRGAGTCPYKAIITIYEGGSLGWAIGEPGPVHIRQ